MQPNMCLIFPSSCFYMSQDFDNLLATVNLPLTHDGMIKISKRLVAELKAASLNITDLQIERAKKTYRGNS